MEFAVRRPISATRVGTVVRPREVSVTARMIMAYAAGIGATDDKYFDDLRPGGVVAPLPFITTLEWPVLMSSDYLSAIGRDNDSAFEGLVHGFQDSSFSKAIKPEMRLEVSGQITEVVATPAGALVVCRIRTTDCSDGTIVAESWFGSMYRQTTVDGPSSAVQARPPLRDSAALPIGAAQESVRIDIARNQPHVYTECAQIWNPIHTERRYAVEDGLPDIILHGTCTWAMALQRLAVRFAAGSASIPFRRFGARFSNVVVPGAPISLEHSIPDNGRIAFVVRNSQGEVALSHGVAEPSQPR